MASKNNTQVIIDGKVYTLSGYESEDYLQKVAGYLNNKITEIKMLIFVNRIRISQFQRFEIWRWGK